MRRSRRRGEAAGAGTHWWSGGGRRSGFRASCAELGRSAPSPAAASTSALLLAGDENPPLEDLLILIIRFPVSVGKACCTLGVVAGEVVGVAGASGRTARAGSVAGSKREAACSSSAAGAF